MFFKMKYLNNSKYIGIKVKKVKLLGSLNNNFSNKFHKNLRTISTSNKLKVNKHKLFILKKSHEAFRKTS